MSNKVKTDKKKVKERRITIKHGETGCKFFTNEDGDLHMEYVYGPYADELPKFMVNAIKLVTSDAKNFEAFTKLVGVLHEKWKQEVGVLYEVAEKERLEKEEVGE